VILRIAADMYNAHEQAQCKLSLEEFQAMSLMICRVPDCPRIDVGEAFDEERDSFFVQIVKLHYEI
jgi:hypothetical protein